LKRGHGLRLEAIDRIPVDVRVSELRSFFRDRADRLPLGELLRDPALPGLVEAATPMLAAADHRMDPEPLTGLASVILVLIPLRIPLVLPRLHIGWHNSPLRNP
jgi:hypothetical protein